MIGADRGIVLRQLGRLFRDGTLSGLSEAQLLDCYLTRHDDSAFEALLNRHGPLVLGVCRRMLHDPRDIEDAFQATFLILVRKAPSIHDGRTLANWLYGVAYRVASRARRTALRRRSREISIEFGTLTAPAIAGTSELGPILDEELARLPEKFRAPLVLCYLNGKTHEQAAGLLDCPVGTVRSRMSRGREILRSRLTQRGLAPSAAVFAGRPAWSFLLISESVPSTLISATTKAAMHFGSSQAINAAAIAASVLSLTQGVVKTMTFASLKWAGLAVLATTISAGGVVAVGYASNATDQDTPEVHATVLKRDEKNAPNIAPTQSAPSTAAATAVQLETRLEAKLDDLLTRILASDKKLGPSTSTSRGKPSPSTAGVSQTLKHLELALEDFDRILLKVKQKNMALDDEKLVRARSEILLTAAQLQDLKDELLEQLERTKSETSQQRAELDKAKAQQDVATSVVARNKRLNERKPGMVSAEDVAKAAAELSLAEAHVRLKQAELDLNSLQAAQLTQLAEKIQKNLEMSRGGIEYAQTVIEKSMGARTLVDRGAESPIGSVPPAGPLAARLPAATASTPTQPWTNSSEISQESNSRPSSSTSNLSIRLLELPLVRELEQFQSRTPALTTAERAESRAQINYHISVLSSVMADLDEEIDRLKIDVNAKNADLSVARAWQQRSWATYANMKKLHENGEVSATVFWQAQYDQDTAGPRTASAEAAVQAVKLRIAQLEKKKRDLTILVTRASKVVARDHRSTSLPSSLP